MNEEGKGAKFVYYSLIVTFVALYLCVAFVSTLHAITFFQLANNLTLAIFLGAAFEIGQASVLFSILMTKNKHRTMAWSMMFLLTTLQITANVFASFKFMDQSGTVDWTYWQRSILFWLEADTPEIYKVTIAWITGALLPIVALGMTALAADNIKLNHERVDLDYDEEDYDEYDDYDDTSDNEEKPYEGSFDEPEIIKTNESLDEQDPSFTSTLKESQILSLKAKQKGKGINFDSTNKLINKIKKDVEEDIQPVNKPRAWHLKNEFIDDAGNVFNKGKYSHKTAIPKKA